jgi:isocitrate dehydrogenase (NAD+)
LPPSPRILYRRQGDAVRRIDDDRANALSTDRRSTAWREGGPIVAHEVTLIPGDGAGPEICAAAQRCLDAVGVSIEWDVQPAGLDAEERFGVPLPDSTIASLRRTKVALKGPLAAAQKAAGSMPRSVGVYLRQEFDLFASVRPAKLHPGATTLFTAPLDVVIVRENTEDLYMGFEFEANRRETDLVLEAMHKASGRRLRAGYGLSVKPISKEASRRIADFAFDYAVRMGRRRVTAVHKANLMKATDGLFLQAAKEVAKEYPQIAFDDKLIDSACMQLVTQPGAFDVIVTTNLYGDILSDLTLGISGGLATAPAANVGEKAAVFETLHGPAMKSKGKNTANPTAMILAGVLMLRHLGEAAAADRLEAAVATVLGRVGPDPRTLGCQQMADAVVSATG